MAREIRFLSVFALSGSALLVAVVWTLLSAHGARKWEPVPAQVLTTELELFSQKEDRRYYRLKAQYTYNFQGQTYSSSRVGVNRTLAIDTREEAQRKLFGSLRSHQESGESFTCYVNPRRPSQAVLVREVSLRLLFPWLLIGVLFAGVGWTTIAVVVLGEKVKRSHRGDRSRRRPAKAPAPPVTASARAEGSTRPTAPAAARGGRVVAMAMLLGANALALAVALHEGWTLEWLVPIYWFQSLLISLSSGARLALFPGARVSDAVRVNISGQSIEEPALVKLLGLLATGTFFGAFHLLHLMFVVQVFDVRWVFDRAFWIAVGAFALGQLWELGRAVAGDRALGSTTRLSYAPIFGRIVVIHLVLVLGMGLAGSVAGLVLFLVLKTSLDLVLYRREMSASSP